jgi:FimV-like protein
MVLGIAIIGQAEVQHYGPTHSGDVVWDIAAQIAPDSSVTRHQVIIALLKANPHAFRVPCNINTLKIKQILRIPSLTEIQVLSPQAAQQAYQQQNKAWQAYRQHQRPFICPTISTHEQAIAAKSNLRVNSSAHQQPITESISPPLQKSPIDYQQSVVASSLTTVPQNPPVNKSLPWFQIILLLGTSLFLAILVGWWWYWHTRNTKQDKKPSLLQQLMSKPLSRLLLILHQYPLWALGTLFVLGMLTILLNLYYLASQISESMAIQHATVYTKSLGIFRAFYSSEVVARVKPKGIQISHDYKNLDGAIPFPATLSIELGKELSQSQNGSQARLFSNYPFPWRQSEGGPRDSFEIQALQYAEHNSIQPFIRFEPVQGHFSLRFAKPVVMKASCIGCHNSHPHSPKTDWKIGDVRGVQEVILPLGQVEGKTQQGLLKTLIIMTLITLIILGLLALVIKELRKSLLQVSTLAEETKQINKELAKTNNAYRRFLPYEFLTALKKESIINVQLGDNIETQMTVLFSDLRSFTTISENMSPEENFRFLNDYLSQMGPAIRNNHGFIDKYIGDAIMALFQQSADDAVKAGITMLQTLHEYNTKLNQAGQVAIQMGIGIHTGSMMLGTIGEQNRMETTVISDAVNLASRLEGMTKMYGVSLLISEQTFHNLKHPQQFSIRTIDRVKAKGKREPVTVFEVYDGDQPTWYQLKKMTQPLFEQGIIEYQNQNLLKAQQCFETCMVQNSLDIATQLYVKRCQHYLAEGWGQEWDGVTQLDSK